MIAIVGIKYLMLSLYLLYHGVVDILRGSMDHSLLLV